jgi:hypothetical protein
VAHRSGLGTSANLRNRIKEHTGLSPSAYAQRFATGLPGRSLATTRPRTSPVSDRRCASTVVWVRG